MIKGISFETYPPCFNEDGSENENYDNEVKVFVVPHEWAERWLRKNYDCSIAEFLETYDWDGTVQMNYDAAVDGAILLEWIELRDFRTPEEWGDDWFKRFPGALHGK